jgi:ABC-type polysaccharide/polyol phosphate export permease
MGRKSRPKLAASPTLANNGAMASTSMIALRAPSPIDATGLVWTLVRTDFKVRYHGTIMGFFWALAKPVTMFVVLTGVFSLIFNQDPYYRTNLLIGLFLWDFFQEGTKVGLLSLANKGYLLGKTRFPRWILVVTSISNPLITLAVFSVTVLVYLAAAGRMPPLSHVVLFIFYETQLVAIVVGFSLATSALFLRYRDLNQIWELVTYAGFFLAPIVYPLRILPERVHFFLYMWLPTAPIQFSREVLVEGSIPTLRAHGMLFGLATLLLAAGVVLFRSLAPDAAEHL